MTTNLKRFKGDLSKLISLGNEMEYDLAFRQTDKEELKKEIREKGEKLKGSFEESYQLWYTESLALIKQLMPDRFLEFSQLYHGAPFSFPLTSREMTSSSSTNMG